MQFCREQGEIIICGDPSTLVQQQWSGWTKVFLDKFCPRKDWVQRRANFILHLQADMIVAHQNHMWFKFKLRHLGGAYSPLEPPVFTQQKYKRMEKNGRLLDNLIQTITIPLNLKFESIFQGELCFIPNEVMIGSDVEQCFSNCLFMDTKFGYDNESDRFVGCRCG